MMTPEIAASLAGPLLRAEGGLPIQDVITDYDGSPTTVIRCQWQGRPVIVKAAKNDGSGLPTEAAALQFLAQVQGTEGWVPRLMAASEQVVVMTDLGPDRLLLAKVLEGDDFQRSKRALHAFMVRLAQLHGLASRERHKWVTPSSYSRHRAHSLDADLLRLPQILHLAAVPCPPTLITELENAAYRLLEPGPFLGFAHGDATTANALVTTEGDVRLYDFEAAGFRNVLTDGAFPVLRFLHSMYALQIPKRMRQDLASTYRRELARWMPEADEGRLYYPSIAAAAAGWLAGLLANLDKQLASDMRWGMSTFRERTLEGLRLFIEFSTETNQMTALADACYSLLHELTARWGRLEMRMYHSLM